MKHLDILFRYEKYIPVLSEEEQKSLLDAAPSLVQLQDWEMRLRSRSAELDERFKRSYDKIIKQRKCRKTTSY